MTDANIYKEYAATPGERIEQYIMDPRHPKSEGEWWASREITRLRAENDTLRRDVRTDVMGDSAELQDVKRENEKLRAAFRVNMLRAFSHMSHEEIDAEIAAAIRESGDE